MFEALLPIFYAITALGALGAAVITIIIAVGIPATAFVGYTKGREEFWD